MTQSEHRNRRPQTAGLLGGMSWESTVTYYQLLNRGVSARLGGLHSAPCVIHSVDFQEIADLQKRGDWERSARVLADAARGLEAAGADFVMICTNTMHQVADQVADAVNVPLLHIADATGEAIQAAGHDKVGLLGTKFTMEMGFYRDRLRDRYGIDTVVPGEARREEINRVIFEELCRGRVRPSSRDVLIDEIGALARLGAQAVVLGCTELDLLVDGERSPVPVIDTTRVHAEAALAMMFGERGAESSRERAAS